jgi:hypothetical protein
VSVLLQLLTVAGVIALMITLRLLINRQVMRQRLAGRTGKDCEDKECFGGCGGLRPEAGPNRAE